MKKPSKERITSLKKVVIDWVLGKNEISGLTKEEADELRKECEALNYGIEDVKKSEEELTEEERLRLQQKRERYWRWRELCRIEEKRMEKWNHSSFDTEVKKNFRLD